MKNKDEPVVVRFSKLAGNTVVSNTFIDELGSSYGPSGIAVYVCLCRFANWDTGKSFPSVKTIEEKTGMKKNAILKYLKRLEKDGIIAVEKVKAKNFFRNEYVLLAPSEWSTSIPKIPVRVSLGYPNSSVEQNSKEQLMIPQDELAGSGEREFVWEEYLEDMRKNKNRAINVIARFFREKNLTFSDRKAVSSAIRRHLKAANEVKNWTNDEIDDAMERLQDCKFDWTLESVWKVLTK